MSFRLFDYTEQISMPDMKEIAAGILEKIQEVTGISGKWKPDGTRKNASVDGYIQLTIQKKSFNFPVEIKSGKQLFLTHVGRPGWSALRHLC